MRQRGREGHAADLHMAGDEVEDRCAAAAIDDMDKLRLLLRRHVFGDHVADRADARRHVFDAVRRRAHQGDQLLEALRRRGRMHHEHVGRTAEIGDVGEVAHRIEPGVLRIHRRRQHVGRHAGRHQRVAVGLAARDRLGADEPAAAGAVLDEELLPEGFAQPLREHPRQKIVGAARRIGDDDAHRLRRPLGRSDGACGASAASMKAASAA